MSPSFRWMLAGSLTAGLTLLLPPLTLLAWLLERSAVPGLVLSLFVAPILFGRMMRALQGNSQRMRALWVQAFGAGAVLMPLVLFGFVLRLVLPPFQTGFIVSLVWLLLMVFAWRSANRIHERSLVIKAPQLDKTTNIVHISDVHVGSRSPAYLAKVITQVMSHEPELVLITGDLLDTSEVGVDQLQALSRLTCPTYLCIGNHERYVNLDAAIAAIEHHGVIVLRDEAVMLGKLRLIGLDDRDRPDVLPGIIDQLDRSIPAFEIGLYHRPDGWQALAERGVQLTLSGHTHGGQIWPFGLLVKRQYPQMVGLFEQQGNSLYVSPGTGTWGPTLRLGTRCEMTLIELDASSVSS